jgi:hypothetical protein
MRYLRRLCAAFRALGIAALASAAVTGAHAQSPDPDTAAWNRARQQHTVEAYQRYLERYPLGVYSAEAFQAMVELLKVREGPDPPEDQALPGVDMY